MNKKLLIAKAGNQLLNIMENIWNTKEINHRRNKWVGTGIFKVYIS